MISSAWQLYRAHFGVILGMVIAIGLPCELLLSYMDYFVFSKDEVAATLDNLQSALVLSGVFGIVITGGILHALFVDRMERRAGFPECLSTGVTHWFQLFWTNLLFMALLFFGTLVFILPGIIAAIRLCLANTVVITEGKWGFDALKRSLDLTANRSLKVVALGIMLFVPLQIIPVLAAQMLLTIPVLNNWLIAAGLGTFVQLIGSFITVCFFRLYETFVSEEAAEA